MPQELRGQYILDIMLVYNSALTTIEITQNYNAVRGRYGL
jgi:hypothetical protein